MTNPHDLNRRYDNVTVKTSSRSMGEYFGDRAGNDSARSTVSYISSVVLLVLTVGTLIKAGAVAATVALLILFICNLHVAGRYAANWRVFAIAQQLANAVDQDMKSISDQDERAINRIGNALGEALVQATNGKGTVTVNEARESRDDDEPFGRKVSGL